MACAAGLEGPLDFLLHLRRRAEGEDVLAVDIRPESHPAARVAGDPVMADDSGLDVDGVHADLDEVADDLVHGPIAMEPDVHAGRLHALEHGRVAGLEDPPPGFGLDEQGALASPVVAEMEAVVFEPSPLIDPA